MVAIEHRQKSSTAATATATATSAATINIAVLSPTSSASSASAASNTTTTTTSSIQPQHQHHQQQQQQQQQQLIEKPEEEKKQLVEETLKLTQKSPKQKHSNIQSDKMSQLESPADTKTSEKQQPQHNKAGGGAVSKSAVSQRNVDIKITKKSNLDAATKELTKKVLKLDLTGKDLDEFSIKSPKSPIARLPHQTSLTSSVDVEDRKTLREALYQGIFHRHRRTIFAVGSFLRMLRSRNSQYNTIRSSSEGEDVDEVR